ncbi:hypothetical protein PR003_g2936 [Phytophthora rubi]|uniref:Uncharacterized protein n=1 Tax=Phytophthora rubi TaxID=129364 RepID=A0A6A4G0S2_9STRA|nr:hypothetical protein PR003_g2936 [Phytophthora rubi]
MKLMTLRTNEDEKCFVLELSMARRMVYNWRRVRQLGVRLVAQREYLKQGRNGQHCVGAYAKSGEEREDESDDVYGGVHEIEHIDKSEDGQDEEGGDNNDGGYDKECSKERSKLYGDASG